MPKDKKASVIEKLQNALGKESLKSGSEAKEVAKNIDIKKKIVASARFRYHLKKYAVGEEFDGSNLTEKEIVSLFKRGLVKNK